MIRAYVSTCLALLFLVIHIQTKLEPSFTSNEGVHDVIEDRSLQLPCQVQNLGENDYAVIWKKVEGEEQRILFVDNEAMSNDQRFRLDYEQGERFDLNLNRVERYDSGVYQCEIITTPSKIQKHIVNVRFPPTVNLAPDRDPYMVKSGESIELTCYASGNPMPSILWRREGQPLPDDRLYSEGTQLRYDNVNASYDGIYECTANNEVGHEAKAKIEVQVHSFNGTPDYGPWVKALVKYIPVASGANVNVACKYDGKPELNVNWFFNSHPVDFTNDRFKRLVRRDHSFTEVTLAIHGIQESDYGNYTCRIANNLGTVEENIHVSAQQSFKLMVKTSTEKDAQSDPGFHKVFIKVYDITNQKWSEEIMLDNLAENDFESGAIDVFNFNPNNTGTEDNKWIGLKNLSEDGWLVQSITLEDVVAKKT